LRTIDNTLCIAAKVELDVIAKLTNLVLIRASMHEARSKMSDARVFDTCHVWNLDEDISNYDSMRFSISDGSHLSLSLRSSSSIQNFAKLVTGSTVVIDITGFDHSYWAWLIRAALESPAENVFALYVEPESYTFSESPIGGEFFELSEIIRGIQPLPSFATIRPRRADFVFVPLLGFEGARLTYMIEQVQPNQTLTYPVVGVPGFQLDFPFFTIQGNRRALLKEENLWSNRRYARANCPNSVYTLLSNIHQEHPDKVIKIAPIGTKPHALGAVLFKIMHENIVDLIYDHPIRKSGRTLGTSSALLYNLNLYRGVV
jgi:hypothetical protein